MDYIFTRRSVRKFDTSQKLNKEELIELVKAGFYAPSAKNQCLREFLIIDDKKIIEELQEISPGAKILLTCSSVICVLGVLDETARAFMMNDQDLSASTQNIMLYARSKDIGSCWIGVHPIEDRKQKVTDILNLPNNLYPFSLIALGYPQNEDAFYDGDKMNMEKIHFNKF